MAQTPPSGPELQVNTYTTGDQFGPGVGVDASGNFVVVWTSNGEDGSNSGVFGQRYDSSGVPQGGEFPVNTYTTGDQRAPSVSMNGPGNFVIVWTSNLEDGSSYGIFGQRYDSSGVPQGGEFQVNTYTTGSQWIPSVGMDSLGNFVVVWQSNGQDGSSYGVFGQRYDSTGVKQGSEFQVNTYTTGSQYGTSVGMDTSGNFVVVWTSDGQDGSGLGVFGQRYNSAGMPQGGEFQVNTYTTGAQILPSIAMDAAGDFVVAWSSSGQDGSGYGVFGQRYDSAGAKQGGEFRVNTYTTGTQFAFRGIGMDTAGNFVIAWMNNLEDGSGYGIFGQRFKSSGSRTGSEFQINTYTAGDQRFPSVAMNGSGNFVVDWRSNGQDGSGYGVFAKRGEFHAAQPMMVDAHGTGGSSNLNGVLEPGETVQVEPSWMDTVTVPLTFTGTASNLTGPPGPTYTINDNIADYGTVTPGATTDCYNATTAHDCYAMTVSGTRPTQHWDATFDEALSTAFTITPGLTKRWTLHVGDSFPDVPTSNQFYAFTENLFHNGVTGGCGGDNYCPTSSVTRAQMAVFLLKSEHGSSFMPPPCTGVFPDVLCPSLFADWIEQLFAEGITGGCGGGNYCPNNPVTRAQMAVFLLKAEHGSSYTPPSCTGIFPDVPCPSQFADWIEQLFAEGITGGCGGGNYCPNNPNTRGQMAVFLVKTFDLQLYGP